MKINLLARILLGLFLLWGCTARAQVGRDYILTHPHAATAHYATYPDSVPTQSLPPEGYEVFYLSHYGRHGSRYHTSRTTCRKALRVLESARELELLTPAGERLRERIALLAADAEGRAGSLSPRGVEEHRAIAGRMFRSFPALFAGEGCIECRATQSPRAILSMAANNERLRELNPRLAIVRRADKGEEAFLRHTPYMLAHKGRMGRLQTGFLRERLDCSRFAASLFRVDPGVLMDVEQLRDFMCDVYAAYAIAGCLGHLDVRLDDVFTPDELFVLWQGQNLRNYLQCAHSVEFGDSVTADARPLLRDIVMRADAAIAGGGVVADLRFGHDVALAPLLALIGLDGRDAQCSDPERLHEVWCDFLVMPMAANVQFVFYRPEKGGQVLVKVLHNEREGRLPLDTDRFPYYRWEEVRNYLLEILNR